MIMAAGIALTVWMQFSDGQSSRLDLFGDSSSLGLIEALLGIVLVFLSTF